VKEKTTYQIVVEEAGNKITSATTTTPTTESPDRNPQSGNCLTNFSIRFKGIEDQRRVDVELEAKYDGQWYELDRYANTRAQGNSAIAFQPENLFINLIPSRDRDRTRCKYESRCHLLDSDKIRISYRYLGPNWYKDEIPLDSLTSDILSSADVVNGPGFFRSLHRGNTTITVDTSNAIPLDGPTCGR
jgi:hypothetical protein